MEHVCYVCLKHYTCPLCSASNQDDSKIACCQSMLYPRLVGLNFICCKSCHRDYVKYYTIHPVLKKTGELKSISC